MLEQGKDEHTVQNARCKMCTFGSFRLGVHSPGTDIDMLIVGPSAIDRQKHFFGNLYNILKQTVGITDCTPVPYTQIPIIKITFRGVDFDLLYA